MEPLWNLEDFNLTNTIKLTDKSIAALQPKDKNYDIWDTEIKGFTIRVSVTGTKSFRFMHYFAGQRKVFTIGKFGTLTCAQAREIVKLKAGQVATGINVQQEKIDSRQKSFHELNFQEFVEGPYFEWRKANRKNPEDTLNRLKYCFFEDYSKVALKDFSVLMLETWKTKRLNAGIKPDTVNRDIAELRAVLSKAVDWEILEDHPLKKLKQSKVDKTTIARFLDDLEKVSLRAALIRRDERIRQERIRANEWRAKRRYDLLPEIQADHYADHLHPMILVSLNSGFRQGELFSGAWEDANFSTRLFTVKGKGTKSSQTRFVPMNNEMTHVLNVWQQQNGGIASGLIFPSTVTGEEFDNVCKAWASIKEDAGIKKFRWHDMRHHFASMLVMVGVDLNTVRELLGHADLKTTLRYAHLAPQHKSRAVDLISV